VVVASEACFQIYSTQRHFPSIGGNGGSCSAFELGERGRGTGERGGGRVVQEEGLVYDANKGYHSLGGGEWVAVRRCQSCYVTIGIHVRTHVPSRTRGPCPNWTLHIVTESGCDSL
jgi:hypothetical protein